MAELDQLLPPLATLVPFEAAFRHRSFTRAAEELHLSQASVSRRVRELETDLGLALFERHRYDVIPTAAAESLAASIRLSFGELSSTAASLRRRSDGSRALTIFSDLSLATALIAPVLGDFQRSHPDLEIRVVSSYEPIHTTREDLDLGLQYATTDLAAFAVEPIADDWVFPVCSPGIAAEIGNAATAGDLLGQPLLDVAYGGPEWTNWKSFVGSLGMNETPVVAMTFTSYHVCLDVAERGEGVALGWARSVQPRLDAGVLCRVPGFVLIQPDVIHAYRPKRRAPNPEADEFLTLVRGRVPMLE